MRNAKVSGNAKVYGTANVYGDACIFGNAKVYGNAYVYGKAVVHGNSLIFGEARIKSGEWNKTPLQIWGSIHFLNMLTPKILKIGCEEHTIPTWLKDYRTIAAENEITDKETIKEYGENIRWFAERYCPEALEGENNEV